MEVKKIVSDVSDKIKPVVENLGYELVDVEYKKLFGSVNLTVVIFKKGDMSLTDCETVHNAISDLLDEVEALGNDPYVLNVSSMGLDRPLVSPDDFRRRQGEEIEISLYSAVDKQKIFVGTLISADNDYIEIENKKIYKLERKNVARVRPYVKF